VCKRACSPTSRPAPSKPVLIELDAQALQRHLPWPALVQALREMYVQGCEVPPRQAHAVDGAGRVLVMPAWQEGKYFGIKTVAIFPQNSARGLPSVHASYALFDAQTGVPLATMDGSDLTARRTAATSALAAHFLARQDATRLLIVGAGRVASCIAPALRAVRPNLLEVTVFNRSPAAAQALATRLCSEGFQAQATVKLEDAVRQAHIVSCATLATTPLVLGQWLAAGTHLDLIGSFTPEMCEADAACFARGRVFVDSEEALHKAGDIVQAIAQRHFDLHQLQGSLQALCRGEVSGRRTAQEMTVFKSVGSALQDLAAAGLVMSGLVAAGLDNGASTV
jgi:ornithine cyclodeaminase/alanine dehydrogenase-like protein (mu-crystallin family)